MHMYVDIYIYIYAFSNVQAQLYIPYDTVMKDYTISTTTIEIIDKWESNRPSSSSNYSEHIVKSYIALALAHLANTHKDAKLRLQQKPYRAVYADEAYDSGKLILVPETMKVSVICPKDTVPTSGMKCNIPKELTSKVFVLMPHFTEKFVAPAWAVRSSDVEDNQNMYIQMKFVQVAVGSGVGKGKTTNSVSIGIPVLVNATEVGNNDELLFYKPAVQKKGVKRTMSINLEPSKISKV